MIKTTFKILYVLYIVMLICLSLMPLGNFHTLNTHDKINHFLAFLVFTIIGFLGYRFKYFYLFLIGISVGSMIEILQSFTKYRSAELLDLFADTVGILVGIIIIILFNKLIFMANGKRSLTMYNINLKKF